MFSLHTPIPSALLSSPLPPHSSLLRSRLARGHALGYIHYQLYIHLLPTFHSPSTLPPTIYTQSIEALQRRGCYRSRFVARRSGLSIFDSPLPQHLLRSIHPPFVIRRSRISFWIPLSPAYFLKVYLPTHPTSTHHRGLAAARGAIGAASLFAD